MVCVRQADVQNVDRGGFEHALQVRIDLTGDHRGKAACTGRIDVRDGDNTPKRRVLTVGVDVSVCDTPRPDEANLQRSHQGPSSGGCEAARRIVG